MGESGQEARGQEARGQDSMHLGWYVPGEKICLGSGPMRMRLTVGEADALAASLTEMTRESRIRGGHPRGALCGCYDSCADADQVDELIAAARREFTAASFDDGPRVRRSSERQEGTYVLCPYHHAPLPCGRCERGG